METLMNVAREAFENWFVKLTFWVALAGFPFFYALSRIVAMLPSNVGGGN